MDWNSLFTKLIRRDRPSYWGNWSLDMEVRPGAVGVLSRRTGEFRGLGTILPGIETTEETPNQDWKIESKRVRKREVELKASAETAAADVGLEVTWSFARENSIASQFALASEVYVQGITAVVRDQWTLLEGLAKDANMATGDGGIEQGFGVISSVLYAKSGLNIASRSADSSFSISGSVEGVKAMIGQGGGAASFSSIDQSADMVHHQWPAEPGQAPSGLVPVAFTFTSFEGRHIIPHWTRDIRALVLELDKSGSYVVDVRLAYQDADGAARAEERTLIGATNKTISLPLEATNLVLTLDFRMTDQDHELRWGSPLGQWEAGRCTVEVKGWAPGPTSYSVS